MSLLLMLAMLALPNDVPAAAAPAPLAALDPFEQPLGEALGMSRTGRVAEAGRLIDPVLAGYQAKYRAEERRLYCDLSPAETRSYLAATGTETNTAVAIPRNWCVALFLKGYALNDQRDYAGALPYLKQAVAMAPAHAHFLNELGYTYAQLNRQEEAIDAFSKAQASAAAVPSADTVVEQTRALRGSGAALVELSRWDEAEAAYRRSLALDPSDTRSRAELDWIARNRPKVI